MTPRSKREYRETVYLRYKNATRSLIAAIPRRERKPIPLTSLISPPAGQYNGQYGEKGTGALEQIQHIGKTVPFPIRGFDCDNGGEFLNESVKRSLTKLLENLNPFLLTKKGHG